MILMDIYYLSNFNQVEGKFRIMDTYFNQDKFKELQDFLSEKKFPIEQEKFTDVIIKTEDELKLFKELSINRYTIETHKGKRIHTNIKTFSAWNESGDFENRHFNPNMCFNKHIFDFIYGKEKISDANPFLDIVDSLSLEYPDDVQLFIHDNFINFIEEIHQMFYGQWNKINKFTMHMIILGERKLK